MSDFKSYDEWDEYYRENGVIVGEYNEDGTVHIYQEGE